MRTWRDIRIEQTLKKHDPKLFLSKNGFGEAQIMRQSTKAVAYEVDGVSLINYESAPHYIISLTEDWTGRTPPCEWGLEAITRKLQEIDGWNSDSLVNKMFEHNEKVDKAKARALQNETEAFVKDWRSDFAKHTSDLLTHSLEKKDSRRKKDQKHGYCKP